MAVAPFWKVIWPRVCQALPCLRKRAFGRIFMTFVGLACQSRCNGGIPDAQYSRMAEAPEREPRPFEAASPEANIPSSLRAGRSLAGLFASGGAGHGHAGGPPITAPLAPTAASVDTHSTQQVAPADASLFRSVIAFNVVMIVSLFIRLW